MGTAYINWRQSANCQLGTAARFEPTELGADAAVTTAAHGAGRVSYVATVPNPAMSRSIARWLVPEPAKRRWAAADTVTVAAGRSRGRDIVFLSNWSDADASATTPAAMRDLVSGTLHAAGASILLEGRSAIVLEAASDSTE